MAQPAYEADAATIANGASQSSIINVRGRDVVGVQMPAAFTGTAITFTASFDGATFQALYDTAGNAVSYTVAASRYIQIPRGTLGGMQALRLVSGSAEGAGRTVQVILQPHVD